MDVTAGKAVAEEAYSATGEQAAPGVGEAAAGLTAVPPTLSSSDNPLLLPFFLHPSQGQEGLAPSCSELGPGPNSQVECSVCHKLIQPSLMANHAKYSHVASDLGA